MYPLISYLLIASAVIFTPAYSQQDTPIVLVAYYSHTGNTEKMAHAVSDGLSEITCIEIIVKPIDQVSIAEITAVSAIILGSPVHNGNLPPEVLTFVNNWPFDGRPFTDKLGAAFVTAGGISLGEEAAMHAIHRAMLIHGMVIMGGDQVESAFGASAITGEGPFTDKDIDPFFLEKALGLGRRIGKWVQRLECYNHDL